MNRKLLRIVLALIIENEGFRKKLYTCTEGFYSIGIGTNLESVDISVLNNALGSNFSSNEEAINYFRVNDISLAEAKLIALHYIKESDKELKRNGWYYEEMQDYFKIVLMDLCYNLGIVKLNKFVKFKRHIKNCEVMDSIKELRNSRYYRQVPNRANKLIEILINGGIQ